MTNKNPVRSCEDVDESVLSYAEIKALCIGDPRIKEKMDLDIQVSKLRMLEGSHKSQQYRLQDMALKYYPKEIERAKERISGLEKDFSTLFTFSATSRLPGHADEGFSMTVSGRIFGKEERKEAGEAILEACRELHGVKTAAAIGEYKGFEMKASYSFMTQRVTVTLKADGVTHHAELGESATGNLTRIDNALASIPEQLESEKTRLTDLCKQLEAAKEEMSQPFPKEQELAEKSARLAELDILLSIDNNKQPEQEGQEEQGEQLNGEEQAKAAAETAPEIPEPSEPVIDAKPQASQAKGFVQEIAQHAPPSASNAPEKVSEEQEKHDVSTENSAAETPSASETQPVAFSPQVGQRVVFHPHGGTGSVKLTGKVVAVGEKTITVKAGSKKIPVYKDKGTFELERDSVTRNSVEKGGKGFER